VLNGSLTIDAFRYTSYTHRFGSAKHLGEVPAGEWILNISDTFSGDTGTLHSWSIKVYGHTEGNIVINPQPDSDTGGGGGCSISDQNDVVSDLLAVIMCLMLIPVSVAIRRKRKSQIKCSSA